MMENRRRGWTEEEDKQLKELFMKIPVTEIAKKLARKTENVRNRLDKIITIEDRSGSSWSNLEDEILLKYYGNMPVDELAKLLKRSKRSVTGRISRLEGTKEVSLVTGNYSSYDVSMFLGVTDSNVRRWSLSGHIDMIKVNRKWYIPSDVFWKWVKDNPNNIKANKVRDEDILVAPKWYQDLIAKMKRENSNSIKGEMFTSSEDALIWRLYTTGADIKEITANTKRTQNSVSHRIRVLRKKKWG